MKRRKRKVLVIVCGCMLMLIGANVFVHARLTMHHHGGPALEGSVARLFAIVLFLLGTYFVYLGWTNGKEKS